MLLFLATIKRGCIYFFSVYNGPIKDIISLLPRSRKDTMNNSKDTQKTSINIYEKSNVSDDKSVFSLPVTEVINKRTEKLVTALYLVSDCMETDDAMKNKLRLLGVELVSDIYKLAVLSPSDKRTQIQTSLNRVNEILSFLEIGYNIGFISDMNNSILRKEFRILVNNLETTLVQDKHFSFTLDKRMFDLPVMPSASSTFMSDKSYNSYKNIKDRNSSYNNESPLNNFNQVKKTSSPVLSQADREDRSNKILSLIKDKKEVSIKDISLTINDCSEKTIQRELNSLVSKGQVKKIGSKRWSRYSILETSANN